MEEPVTRRERPAHLICRSVWAVIATLGCAYFAYLSYTSLRDGDFLWQHQLWNSLTWAVWTALAAGLAHLAPTGPPGDPTLRASFDKLEKAIDCWIEQTKLAA